MTENPPKATCFVIGPIGNDGSPTRKHSDLLFYSVIAPALGDKFDCLRADMEQKPGLITDAIIQRINESTLVVADFTTLNPNVFYELGIRHAAAKPTIHMAADGTDLPFDNAGNRVIFFDLSDWHRQERARTELRQQAQDVQDPTFRVSNPVTQALTVRAFSASPDTEEKAIAMILDRVSNLERQAKSRVVAKRTNTSPADSTTVNGAQLVDVIGQATERISERRKTLREAVQALSENGHLNADPTQIDNFLDAYSRRPDLFNDAVRMIEAEDFQEFGNVVRTFDDIPF